MPTRSRSPLPRTPAARRRRRPAAQLAAACAVTLLLAACGSSSPGARTARATGSSDGGSAPTLTTIKVAGYGTVVATATGAPVYLLTADPKGSSSCTGACAKLWPPLTVEGTPVAGGGLPASLLSSFRRSDGRRQVLYGGHALYTHPGASATATAGTAADGGVWYLVAPSGRPVTKVSGSGY